MTVTAVQTPTPAPPAPPAVIVESIPAPPWETLPPQVFVMIFLAVVVGAVTILYPLVRAIARRLEGRPVTDAALRAEVDELRARLNEMESQQGRVAELEERVDFAERLLAQGQERARLGGQ